MKSTYSMIFLVVAACLVLCAGCSAKAEAQSAAVWQPSDPAPVAFAEAPSAPAAEVAPEPAAEVVAEAVTAPAVLSPEERRLERAIEAFKAISHPAEYLDEIDAVCAGIKDGSSAFIEDIMAVDAADTENLLILIDKKHSIPATFVPSDMVHLESNNAYPINRNDLNLRISVEAALKRMAYAAKADGLSLLVSSTYRSYEYQEQLFAKWVRIDGLEEAERESARAGTSQHQLGTAIDFGSIEDDYAETAPGRWLTQHAAEYGFSLSFPQGYEPITGFRWECWHYRYIGEAAVRLQQTWFADVQQYMIEFLDCWRNS